MDLCRPREKPRSFIQNILYLKQNHNITLKNTTYPRHKTLD